MSEQRENGRRRFLKTAALAGGAATVAVAAGGAVADSVQSSGPAKPPSSFVTVLTSFSVGALSSFVIVHVTASLAPRVTVLPTSVPPSHDHEPVV